MSSAATASTSTPGARAVERRIRRHTWSFAERLKSEKWEAWVAELHELVREGKVSLDEIEAWRPEELKQTENAQT